MIKLSIIIPFYNVEKYIAQCLDSVFNQDIPEEEYEVICVNDGSPDGSRDIVCSYLPHHPNLRLIDHPRNMKLGAARNTGRKAARGNYIWHVDSDDMIAPNCLKHILKVCEENDLDVLEMGYANMYDDGRLISVSLEQRERDKAIYTGPEYFEKYHLDKVHTICGIWRKVYKRSFLDDNAIYSPPINMGEDEAFAIEVFGKARRMAYLDTDCYLYRRIEQSLSGDPKQKWNAQKWYEASFVCARYMHQAYCRVKNKYSHKVCAALEDMISYDILYWHTYESLMPTKVRRQYFSLCRRDFFRNLYIFEYISFRKSFAYCKYILC